MANEPAAGWYPDPNTPGQRRYWDGSKWTEHTGAQREAQPAQQEQAQPQPQAPAAQPQAPAAQPQAPAAQPQAPAAQPGGFAQPAGFPQQGGAVTSKPGLPPLAIAGFVCGVVGLLFSLTVVCSLFPGLELGIVGIVLSALGSRQAAERGASKALPTAGLICGIIAALIGIGIGIAAAVS